jgi:hypothetical protein
VALIVAAACLVNALSVNYDLDRFGRTHRAWEPFVWEASSAILLIVLLVFPRCVARAIAGKPQRLVWFSLTAVGQLVFFSAAHVTGMVLLRNLAYATVGARYSFNWAPAELLYEGRKDCFAFALIATMFWLAERTVPWPNSAGSGAKVRSAANDHVWLRDGRRRIHVKVYDIAWVGSAGNYVEYVLATGERHLIRGSLQSEEARLASHGIVRVHRTRLVNRTRIVGIVWRSSGDFDVELDTAETLSGSRRYKAAVAHFGSTEL